MLFYGILALALLGVDQWVKHWTVLTFAPPLAGTTYTMDAPRALLPGVVELTRVHNYGAAWSSFSGMRWLLIGVTTAIVVAVAVVVVRKIVRHPLGLTACALILSGGVGNLIDRLRMGYVVDMFNFQFIHYPVFNVADICVVSGAILAAIYYLWFYEKYDQKDSAHGKA
ncbi:MAG: signal peptidase II [Oscillospiraceae bacterium]